jgi:hypothetical protein
MRTILTAIILWVSSFVFSQEVMVGDLNDKPFRMKFKSHYLFVQFNLDGQESAWHRVFDLEEFSYSQETCHSFSYISSSGIVEVIFCDDGSLAMKMPSGDVLEGNYYYIKENNL